MRKIINDPQDFVDEVIDGLLLAHPDHLRAVDADRRVLATTTVVPNQVGIVTGGGSGHLPLFLGYVGQGLCTAVAIGNVFSSPSAEQMAAAITAADAGAGVLCLYGNYGGDVLNFDLACDLVDGVQTATVLGVDDVLSAPKQRADTRRGVAGLVFAYKVAGAAAARGASLAEVTEVARRATAATGTAGVGLSPTILPAAGKPTFTLAEGEMEIGIGIHGEPGRQRGPLQTADEITEMLIRPVLEDLEITAGDRVAVLVNGLGSTPAEELYLIYRKAAQLLAEAGVSIARRYIGEYATSLEMAGASLSLLRLDDELLTLLDAPAFSPLVSFGG
ncbi:MAG: dihydroxyacetone kinase [Actinobacteria bacterium HGW-Actinobacteria-2]|nr:MAG: dihydroxyacetone kinase [Actinobacteria bacterium HGW-Actinobacteria-2]